MYIQTFIWERYFVWRCILTLFSLLEKHTIRESFRFILKNCLDINYKGVFGIKFIGLKIFTTLVTSLIISVALAFNYIYFSHNPPNYDEFFISLFGYSLDVLSLFVGGASVSLILDFKIKNKFHNFVSYIFSGCLVGIIFCFIDFLGISIRDISLMMILGFICAILFWLMQKILKRAFYKHSTDLF